jgi:hypothetical protein
MPACHGRNAHLTKISKAFTDGLISLLPDTPALTVDADADVDTMAGVVCSVSPVMLTTLPLQ